LSVILEKIDLRFIWFKICILELYTDILIIINILIH